MSANRAAGCGVVELTADRLMLNMRNYDRSEHVRQIAISADGGLTWGDQRFDPALVEPICQASIRRYSWPEQGENIILFSNPASDSSRVNMTLRLSYDEGRSWPIAKTLHPGPSAYRAAGCGLVLSGAPRRRDRLPLRGRPESPARIHHPGDTHAGLAEARMRRARVRAGMGQPGAAPVGRARVRGSKLHPAR